MGPADVETKTCRACGRDLHWRHFAQIGSRNPATGRRRGDHTCRDCRTADRRSAGIQARRKRINAAGDVWCPRCRRYLPHDAFYFRRARNQPYPYCKACDRALKKAREARYSEDRYLDYLRYRTTKRRKARASEHLERRRFVAGAIATLGRRGCTQAMIAALFGTSPATIGAWAKHTRLPVPNAAARFAVLLRETAHLPEGPEPVRRVRPFAGFDELVARVRPKVLAFPIRSKWKTFEEQAA